MSNVVSSSNSSTSLSSSLSTSGSSSSHQNFEGANSAIAWYNNLNGACNSTNTSSILNHHQMYQQETSSSDNVNNLHFMNNNINNSNNIIVNSRGGSDTKLGGGVAMGNERRQKSALGALIMVNNISGQDNSAEIDAAVTFLTDIIKAAQFSDQTAENFRQALKLLLKQYYEGHWYPQEPLKGSGYRCLRVNGVMNPLLKKAAEMCGLPLKRFRHAFPVELTVWVDPGDVSVRFGEEGSIGVYYAKSGNGLSHDHQQMVVDLQRLASGAPRRYSPQMITNNENGLNSNVVVNNGGMVSNNSGRSSSSPFAPSSSTSQSSSSSYVFSPYDGKSVRINSQSITTGGGHPQQPMTPSRKLPGSAQALFQAAMAAADQRRSPPGPLFSSTSSSGYPAQHAHPHQHQGSPHHHNLFSQMVFGQSQQQQHQQPSALDLEAISASRRTPPQFSTTQSGVRGSHQHQETPIFGAPGSSQSAASASAVGSDWCKGEFQFYGNAHLGSYGQTSPFGRFARFMNVGGRQEPVGAN